MPTFFIIDGVKIVLYFNDHNPPHFDAIIAEYDALVEIETVEIMQGELPKNKRQRVLEWAQNHRDQLWEIWEALN